MFKLICLKETRLILVCLNFTKYAAWSGFFIFQGKAIQQATDKYILLNQLLITLVWFILTKLIVMTSDLLNQFFIAYFENKEIKKQWEKHFPKKIFQDNEGKSNLMYLMYFDYLPNYFNLECIIVNNQCTIISVITIVLGLLFYTRFYYGLVALLVIFILTFISKGLFLKKLDDNHKQINATKVVTLGWINQFFRSYREVSFSWYNQIDEWINSIYLPLNQSKSEMIKTQLKRDMLSQLLIEIPFVINTSIVVVAVYLDYLSITQMFVWVGLSQFIINATNSYLENKINYDKKNALMQQLQEIINSFSLFEIKNNINQDNIEQISKDISIKLQDNTINHLSLKPSIYHIQGKNGSGKSTLLNVITGYERRIKVDNHDNLIKLLKNFSAQNVRVIEREPEIFNLFASFNQQALGPKKSRSFYWIDLLNEKMTGLLSNYLINELMQAFSKIEEKFYRRQNGSYSSGEKILISLLRVLTSWDKSVFILVADECLAFLDPKSKKLLIQCFYELSNTIPVFISSHEPLNFNNFEEYNATVV